MVTLKEAKERWRTHTSKVVKRPFGRAKWSVDEDGIPSVTGDFHTLWFLKRDGDRVYATTVDPFHTMLSKAGRRACSGRLSR